MPDVIPPLLSMTSPLAPDALIPTAFGLEEALSQPFTGVLDLVSKHNNIDPNRLLYQPVSVSLALDKAPVRTVHGLVRHFAATGPLPVRSMFSYRAEIVPRLWFLSQTEDCRIFEKKSTQDIVKAVLQENNVPFAFRTQTTEPRPFTLQYNETDLDFVSRLLQEEGWFYFFSDVDATEPTGEPIQAGTMIISDRVTTLRKTTFGYFKLAPGEAINTLASWQPGRGTAYGSIAHDDFDPDNPGTSLKGVTATTALTAGAANRDAYHWPALTLTQNGVGQRTRYGMEAAEVEAALSHGAGFNPNFTPGVRMDVGVGNTVTQLVLHGVSHQAIDESWRNAPNPPSYSNTFTAFPKAMPWRPARTIRRPRMDGIYSAMVLGPDGQEIYTDELGRVKLRLRWDHRIDATAGNGVWVRVMQPWAGPNTGWSFIPRVGTEVAVSFMDGDPDRPVVIGQFHNGNEKPPWALPDNKTRSGLRTRSTPNGGSDEFSELWFDDKKGEEQVMLHAQRDLTTEAENNATHTIGNDRTVTVQKGNDKLTVQQGNRSVTVQKGNDNLTVQQGSRTVDVPQGNHTLQSTSGDIIIKTASGNISVKTSTGAITVEAMQSLTLKVGQSSVKLDPSGVSIQGMTVKVEGQIMTTVKAPMLQLNADGILKAAGGIMMLN